MIRRYRALAATAASLILFAPQAWGQQPVHRVGVLMETESPGNTQALLEGLHERGYVVGRNLQIEQRYSQGRNQQLPVLVAELVAFGPEAIVAQSTPNTVAVHAAAPTIPLVFIAATDPVGLGLVESLAHPGGNVTGFTATVPEGFVGKWFQLLKELVPRASRFAVLIDPANQAHQLEKVKFPEYARRLGVELVIFEAGNLDQFETAFETAHTQGVEAIMVPGGPPATIHSAKIVGLAARYRLPAMYFGRRHSQDGGLMSYHPDPVERWRGAAAYVDKILKGERPGDLPVQQPTRFYLVVNLKTAAELGITVPPSILAQADEVIE